MDDTDRRLIAILRHDARRSVTDLAGELGVSRGTVRARLERLETDGTILGYTAVLRSDTETLPVRGLTMVEVEGRMLDKVADALQGFPEITEIHTTNGRWDLVVELEVKSLPDLDGMLRRLRLVPGITASETTLLLATTRSRKPGG